MHTTQYAAVSLKVRRYSRVRTYSARPMYRLLFEMNVVYLPCIWYNLGEVHHGEYPSPVEVDMKERKLLNLDPHHPEVLKRVQEDLRTMPIEELEALLNYREDGIEETHMHEV